MKKLLLAMSMFLAIGVFAQEINTAKSSISFKTKGAKGTLGELKGTVNFDESKLSDATFSVTVDPNTIDTGVKKRDDHLKNPDFFETTKYPTIKFDSKGVKKEGGKYVTTGKMNMHGVEKEAKIIFTYDASSKTFTGEMIVNPSDYSVGSGKKYDGVVVSIVCVIG